MLASYLAIVSYIITLISVLQHVDYCDCTVQRLMTTRAVSAAENSFIIKASTWWIDALD